MSDTIYIYCQRRVYSCGYQIPTAFRFDFIVRRMPYCVFYSKTNIYNSPGVSLFPITNQQKTNQAAHSFRKCVEVWKERWKAAAPRSCRKRSTGLLLSFRGFAISARHCHKSQGERRLPARFASVSLPTLSLCHRPELRTPAGLGRVWAAASASLCL